MSSSIVIAIDGTSASGKSTNARLVAKALEYSYVDTGAMYRTLAWYCVKNETDIHDEKKVVSTLKKWVATLKRFDGEIQMHVDGYYPKAEIRTAETSAAVPVVAAIPKVREWMKDKQRECVKFGNLVMEGRDIGSNVFPETDFKFYLDASLSERSKRREAEGVTEDLASRDRQDSQRKAAPLMVPLGAQMVDTSSQTPEESSQMIIDSVRAALPEDDAT